MGLYACPVRVTETNCALPELLRREARHFFHFVGQLRLIVKSERAVGLCDAVIAFQQFKGFGDARVFVKVKPGYNFSLIK